MLRQSLAAVAASFLAAACTGGAGGTDVVTVPAPIATSEDTGVEGVDRWDCRSGSALEYSAHTDSWGWGITTGDGYPSDALIYTCVEGGPE